MKIFNGITAGKLVACLDPRAARKGSSGFAAGADGDPGRSKAGKGWQGVDGYPRALAGFEPQWPVLKWSGLISNAPLKLFG